MEPFDSAQIPGDRQISNGLDEGELLENLRNAPIFSPQRSPRFLDVHYLQPSPDFFGLQFGFDTSLPPFSTDSVSPLHDLFTSSRVCVSLSSSVEKHQAALRLQKVYKSFRTRRQLADCAIVAEELWWYMLDFAELKRSSISFFDIEKLETAGSRWSRAKTRAAEVEISKDRRAWKLALQHWLEAIDPRHRFGHNLYFYYDTWFDGERKQPFFYWLDIGEGKEVNLERCPRLKLQRQCIKYLGPTERKAYEVAVEDGKFFYKQSGKLLDTRGWPQDAEWIFVFGTSKTLYVGRKHKCTFQHSSFLAGCATLSAGRLVVEDGILKAVWPHSGHYLPTEENFEKFILFLEEHNVDLSIVQQLNRCSLEEETSVEIINPSMDEKLDSRQLDSSDVTKSGYKAVIGDMSCDAVCHSQMKNAMETPKRKRQTKRVITLEDLQPLFGLKREAATKILGVSVSTFKRHCRSNKITWWNGDECSRSLEPGPKIRETPGEKTTSSCKTPSIGGQAETGNQVVDNSIVDTVENLQEQNSLQMENASNEELWQQLNRCSQEEERSVEVIIPSMDEKLDSRQLDQNNRYVWELMFQKSGYKPFSGDMSCTAICHSHMKNAMETSEKKCGTKREITIKDLQPLIGRKCADAAKILGVSVSTFKRHCRCNGIKWWNGGECSRAFELDPKHREKQGEKTTPSCKTPSITGQAETGNQVLDSIVEIEGNLQEQNSFQTYNLSKEVEVAPSEGDSKSSWPMLPCSDPAPKQSVVTIKATYREDTVKFDLSPTSGIVELKEEVAKRVELESDSFKVKYQDEDQEWILIACDADFQGCLEFSSSLGNQSIRILIVDKVSILGSLEKY